MKLAEVLALMNMAVVKSALVLVIAFPIHYYWPMPERSFAQGLQSPSASCAIKFWTLWRLQVVSSCSLRSRFISFIWAYQVARLLSQDVCVHSRSESCSFRYGSFCHSHLYIFPLFFFCFSLALCLFFPKELRGSGRPDRRRASDRLIFSEKKICTAQHNWRACSTFILAQLIPSGTHLTPIQI